MNKKLDNILENEIKRFNTIIAYQDKMSLTEGSYRFYNEADEPGTEEAPVDDAPPVDAAVDGTEGTDGLNDPDMGAEAPATDGTEEMPADDTMGGDEDVTEVDVTDLVNDTNEIKGKISSIEGNLSKMDTIMSKVDSLTNNISKMDTLIGKMEMLAQQVELMRPATEAERRKALAKDSYPFNVSIDQYNNGEGVKTQTDLENKPNKMSMLDNLMADYNDSAVKDSFYAPKENPLMTK
jgi:hypothetical protein